jgi:SAM-dependent methyltransferase
MDPVVSHVAANAARITPGQLVLDPFCGTGSLLLSCAYLGANVVGSDFDVDCLGLAGTDSVPDKDRSKNSRFKRFGEFGGGQCQLGKNTGDNFDYYGLKDRLVALIGMDAALWASGPLSSAPSLAPSLSLLSDTTSDGSNSSPGSDSESVSRGNITARIFSRNNSIEIRESKDLDHFGKVCNILVSLL